MDKFEDVGMLDPIAPAPKESKKGAAGGKASPSKKGKDGAPKKPSLRKINFNRDIYPDFKMNNSYQPPTMIYLPTPDLMKKMIKACLKVDTIQECLDKF